MGNFFITVIFEVSVNGHKDACFASSELNIEDARSSVYKELRSNGIDLNNVRTIRVESMTDKLAA